MSSKVLEKHKNKYLAPQQGVRHIAAWLSEWTLDLEEAEFHEKPVMITEAIPYGSDITKGEGWAEWFEPFFKFVRENPVIKATCYINWEWTPYPQWVNWGDARMEAATADIRDKYIKEMSDPIYFHATDKQTAIKSLYDCKDYKK